MSSLKTNFVQSGIGKNILFLHGWGSDISDFLGSYNHFSKNYHVINLDLWGFGKSETPKEVWGCDDYIKHLYEFVKENHLKNLNLVGHSFGGKLAIKFCNLYPSLCKSLILVDSSGVRKKLSFVKRLKIYRYKKLKELVLQGKKDKMVLEKFGSSDYKNSNGIMKKIMTKVVNEDCENELKSIDIPTLLFWGKQDKDTPLYMAKKMHKQIKNSKLICLNGGHFSHIDNFLEFNKTAQNFWEGIW